MRLKITRIAWRELAQTLGPLLLVLVAMIVALHFLSPARPRTLTMSSGPKGSTFETNAERYQKREALGELSEERFTRPPMNTNQGKVIASTTS